MYRIKALLLKYIILICGVLQLFCIIKYPNNNLGWVISHNSEINPKQSEEKNPMQIYGIKNSEKSTTYRYSSSSKAKSMDQLHQFCDTRNMDLRSWGRQRGRPKEFFKEWKEPAMVFYHTIYNVTFVPNYKVASTTLGHAFAYSDPAVLRLPEEEQNKLKNYTHLGWKSDVMKFQKVKRNEALRPFKNGFTFTFVREPFIRIVSAYIDKFYNVPIQKNRRADSKMKKELHLTNMERNIDLTEFLVYYKNSYLRQGITKFDNHWVPQIMKIYACFFNYTFIGKLENFKDDMEFIIENSGLKEHKKFIELVNQKPKNPTNSKSFIKDKLKDVPKELIEFWQNTILAADYQAFGYDPKNLYSMLS